MSLAVCLIMRDEAPVIRRCLESFIPLLAEGDEAITLDTGSADQTPRLARDAGALLYRAAWTDDFSAARNAGLQIAQDRGHTWGLILDADEQVAPDTWPALRSWLEAAGESAALGLAEVRNTTHDGQVVRLAHPRVLRLDQVRYHGRVHEQPRPLRPSDPPSHTGLCIHHDGYTTREIARKDKAWRNLRLLRAAMADLPVRETEALAYHHWQIARTLGQLWATGRAAPSATLKPEQDPDHPLHHLVRVVEIACKCSGPALVADQYWPTGLIPDLAALPWTWLPVATVDLARALRACCRSVSALKVTWTSQHAWPDMTDLWLQEAEILAALEQAPSDTRALVALERCAQLGPADPARYPGARADLAAAADQLRAQIAARRSDHA